MTTTPVSQGRQILPVATARRSWQVLGRQAAHRRGLAVLALVGTIAAAVFAVAVPILLGRMVDVVVDGGTITGILTLVALLVVCALLAGVLTGVAQRWSNQLGVGMAADLREQVMDRSLRMDSATLEKAGTGDVTSRVTEDVQLINTSVQVAAAVFTSLVTVVVTAFGFAALDWRLALSFLVVVPVYALSLRWYLPASAPLYANARVASAVRTRTVLSALQGSRTIHAYGMERRHTARVDKDSQSAVQASLTAVRTMLWFANTMNTAEVIGLVALLTTGWFLVDADLVTVGAVTAAALMFHRLFGPLGTLLFTFDQIQSAGAALARLVGVADLAVPQPGPDRPRPATAGITARAVAHHYVEGTPVLQGIDVTVPAGSSLAVVGESGAGKTTLAAILGGVFPASAGTVSIGEVSVDDLDPVQLRERVGVVTQEVHTFVGDLRQDLQLAAPGASDDELWTALTVVGADRWVRALPEGLSTRVGEGEHPLSAAQAQQVALARIVLVDPPVVILDEATAEAGSAGARDLEQSARALLAGRTAVVVAHRLTQARECDQIAVMADGRVIELGSHDDLVAAGGTYSELWAAWAH